MGRHASLVVGLAQALQYVIRMGFLAAMVAKAIITSADLPYRYMACFFIKAFVVVTFTNIKLQKIAKVSE